MTLDYRKLLKAYISHVRYETGTDCLDFIIGDHDMSELTNEEKAAIVELAADLIKYDWLRKSYLKTAERLRNAKA